MDIHDSCLFRRQRNNVLKIVISLGAYLSYNNGISQRAEHWCNFDTSKVSIMERAQWRIQAKKVNTRIRMSPYACLLKTSKFHHQGLILELLSCEVLHK